MRSILQRVLKYPVGLVGSIIICIACIVYILQKQQGSISRDAPGQQTASEKASPSAHIDIVAIQRIRGGGQGQEVYTGVEKAVHIISNQSERQRHTMQIRNTEAGFRPESLIPKYFKTFSGDASSMHR